MAAGNHAIHFASSSPRGILSQLVGSEDYTQSVCKSTTRSLFQQHLLLSAFKRQDLQLTRGLRNSAEGKFPMRGDKRHVMGIRS